MMLDLVQFFGSELTDINHKYCPVSFVELRSIRSIRVQKGEAPDQMGVVVDGILYLFQTSGKAVAAAKNLADLVSLDDEQFLVAHASLYANKAAKAIGEVVQEIEDK